ncbi:DUF2752 domain-containing protein [Streptomyces sp. NBC_01190]|uniref:DUF2752 domain-containing protein n=1 Tax=Streptomyces sp. NBC_01190 TaxID=2903767 RepID=UPI0038679529|nr:DUF2752 domain-containing protein [Streptomyces sp. NBC_01190]
MSPPPDPVPVGDKTSSKRLTPHRAPRSRWRRLAPLPALGGTLAAFGYVATVDPNTPGHYPLCPLRYYTGVYCPGCGGLRSAYAIAHGHLRTALECNALAVAGFLLLAVAWAAWSAAALRGKPFAPTLRPGYRNLAIALVVAFTVVRNLPFGGFLAP